MLNRIFLICNPDDPYFTLCTIRGVQVVTLSTQVRQANIAAEARAQDKTLENLINAGRQDILVGQARVESLLAQIIGKQNQALAAAEQAQVCALIF